jgi:hypothetical protein
VFDIFLFVFLFFPCFSDHYIFMFLVLADSAADEPEYANDEYEDGEHIDEDDDEEPYTGPPPVINSKARENSLKPGEDARFPCDVDNAGMYTQIHYKVSYKVP